MCAVNQVCARDRAYKSLIMYAARSESIDVFSDVKQLLVSNLQGGFRDKANKAWRGELEAYDERGKTLLHHAARRACKAVLEAVVEAYRKEGLLDTFLCADDTKGQTPVMHLFRNKRQNNRQQLSEKLDVLTKSDDIEVNENHREETLLMQHHLPPDKRSTAAINSAAHGRVPPGPSSRLPSCRFTHPVVVPTMLMHAAHGGKASFDIALSKLRALGAGKSDVNSEVSGSTKRGGKRID